MVLLFVLGVLLVLLAIVLVATALGEKEQQGVSRSLAVLEAMSTAPKELTEEIDRPFDERVLGPLHDRALAVGRRLSGADTADRIRHKLDLAGNPPGWTVDRVLAGKIIGAIVVMVGFLTFSLLLGFSLPIRIVMVAAGLVAGYLAPAMFLYQKAYDQIGRAHV